MSKNRKKRRTHTQRLPLQMPDQAPSERIPRSRREWEAFVEADEDQAPLRLWQMAKFLPSELFSYAVSYTWAKVPYPMRLLPRGQWLALWRRSGYTVSGRVAPRPRHAVLLYRGCAPGWERGMSWSYHPGIAEYACWLVPDGNGGRVYRGPDSDDPLDSTTSRVVTALVRPNALLGGYHMEGSAETVVEHVVDTTRLKISEISEATAAYSKTEREALTIVRWAI